MKKYTLPILTLSIVVIAVLVLILVPKSSGESNTVTKAKTTTSNSGESSKTIEATLDEDGNVIINKEDLSSTSATFIKYDANGTTIELVAITNSNDGIDVAFNTCQTCNGAPKAYFKLKNGMLVCQNCGNQFSLSSVGKTALGCNPMTVKSTNYEKTDTGIKISKTYLENNVKLFSNVVEH